MRIAVSKQGITRIQAVVLAGVIIVAACVGTIAIHFLQQGPTAQVRDYYKVGVIIELTGDIARAGYLAKRGYDIAVNKVNEKGTITIDGKTYRIELTYYDAKSDPSEAAKAVEKAASDGVDFLLGPESSVCTLGAAPMCEKLKLPMVTGSAESHLIPEQHYRYTFQILLTTRETPEGLLKCMVEDYKLPIRTVAIIGADDAFSKSWCENAKAACEKRGLEVVLFETYPLGITDLTPTLTKIKDKNPDVLINGAFPVNHALLVRNCREIGFNPKVLAVYWGVEAADFIDEVKEDANYVIGPTQWSPETGWSCPVFGSAQGFADEFEKTFGHLPDYTEAGCAATPVFIAEVLKNYKLTPPFDQEKKEKFVNALEEYTCEIFFGRVKFSTESEHWHVNTALVETMVVYQIINGKPLIVSPLKAKEADLVFPKPPWGSP